MTLPRTCDACGCAYEECECRDVADLTLEDLNYVVRTTINKIKEDPVEGISGLNNLIARFRRAKTTGPISEQILRSLEDVRDNLMTGF